MQKSILFIVQNASFPFDKRVSKEAISLRNDGYKVFVISPTSIYDKEKRKNVDGIGVYRYKNYLSDGSFIGFFLEYFLSIIKIFSLTIFLIIKENIKVIHISNPPDFFWPIAIVSKLLGIKFIYDQHDLAPEMFKIRFGVHPSESTTINFIYNILKLNEKLTIKFSDAVITANRSFKAKLIKIYNIKDEKCVVVYNGPNENFIPKKNEELIDKYRNKKIILYVGLMTVTDNIEVVIEAAKKIIIDANRKDCVFILLGDGDVKLEMQSLSKKLNVSNNVEFVGMVDYEKVMEYLYVANVCIAPDLPNGLNEYLTLIKVLEYMKAKKPFVAFDLQETKNMAMDSGFYATDIEDYKNKILFLLDNKVEADRMGRIGYEIIMTKYLWDFSEKKLLGLYHKLFN